MSSQPWYEKKVLLYASLLIFPLGIYGLAKNQSLNFKTKAIAAAIGSAIFAFALFSDDSASTSPSSVEEPQLSAAEVARQDSLERNAWRSKDQKHMAYLMAEDAVKARLRSPSTAEFPSVWDGKSDHVVMLEGQRYIIDSYVDSQNGFGAMLRTNWEAEVQQVSKDQWRVVQLVFEE